MTSAFFRSASLRRLLFSALAVLALGVALAPAALAQKAKKKATKPPKTEAQVDPTSLYRRLGGKPAITAVVDSFTAFVAADERINAFFQTLVLEGRVPKFKEHLVNQICEATGGPCKYKGRSMKKSHAGMGVKGEHFQALVEDLIKALDHFKVPAKEKGELLAILGPMRADIVE